MPRKPETTAFWVGRLPHWEVEGGRYFITLHLAGAIPAAGRDKVRQISAQLRRTNDRSSPDWLRIQRSIFAEMERWLDRAEWNPLLARPEIASVVAEAIEHRHQRGDWRVHEYVIMPTHVHLFCEFGLAGMKAVMEDFKRWTGHQVGLVCRTGPLPPVGPARQAGPLPPVGAVRQTEPLPNERNAVPPQQAAPTARATFRFWQREWFDHWSRSDEEDERTILYIHNNPVKAQLVENYLDWRFASWNRPLP